MFDGEEGMTLALAIPRPIRSQTPISTGELCLKDAGGGSNVHQLYTPGCVYTGCRCRGEFGCERE